MPGFNSGFLNVIKEETETDELETYLTKQFRKKVALISQSTSYQTTDFKPATATTPEKEKDEPFFSKYLQKFRRESEVKRYEPPRRKIKRGTLESHSFTNVRNQPTLKQFYFGTKEGNMHQGDPYFSDSTRNKQGLCMSVAAYCYSILKHPNKWISESIDEILGIGNQLYVESTAALHMHSPEFQLTPKDLQKYCYIGEKKIRFLVDEPEVTGLIRSEDRRVYNLTKGLQIFFTRQPAGILQTHHVSLAIWKDKHYYFFDAKPRTKDLFTSPSGKAVMANFYDIPSIVTVLLDRSNYENWPFVIYAIKAFKVLDKDAPDESAAEITPDSRSNYNIIDENKAVVLGSFDLADKCFDFTRNKQALTMATVCLVYSRITPPSAWHRGTIDKIMVVGNQLYLECIQCEYNSDFKLDNVPAIFTIGPYIVEIYIYANRFADTMYKKCNCQFGSCLTEFFQTNTNAIVQIDAFVLAVWKQRNMFFCFDPYSRNSEGLHCRDGTACVSMHSNVDSLMKLITTNFSSKDHIFYMHALKVCKINRDPVQSDLFPKHLTMNDYSLDCIKQYKMKKSKKRATSKPVTVDYTALAMRKLLAGEIPDPSIFDIGSTVESLTMEQLPQMVQTRTPSKSMLKAKVPKIDQDVVADLDSPSLSDTQIEPPLPQQPLEKEEIEFMDLDSFELTQEEMELQDYGEDEAGNFEQESGDGDKIMPPSYEEEGDDYEDWYEAASRFAQVGPHSLQSLSKSRISEQINTDITFFPIKKDILYPTYIRGKLQMKQRLRPLRYKDDGWDVFVANEPDVTQSQELSKETNFIDLPDDSQIIRGTKNLIHFGDDIEFIAPFACIMSGVVAKKYSIYTWSSDIVDYILKCGAELYKSSKLRYDQVAKLDIPRITLGQTNYKVLVEYIFDTYSRQNILELAIEKILLVRSEIGVLVTPTYSCALIFKNHLYYMYDGFGNNEVGMSEGPSNEGKACLSRFKNVHALATRIMYNKKKRETDVGMVYTRFVLSTVRVKEVKEPEDKKKKTKQMEKEMSKYGDTGEEETEAPFKGEEDEGEEDEETPTEVRKFPNKIGYQYRNGLYVIEGTINLNNRESVTGRLKQDHFACLCACLLLLTVPISKWDTKKVDKALQHGAHVFSHADDLEISEKRSIKNVLIEKNFFDIIVKRIKIETWKNNQNLFVGIDTLLLKRLSYFLVQFPHSCYVVHRSADGVYHVFDPYGIKNRGKKSEVYKAGWVRFTDVQNVKKYLKTLSRNSSYMFYNFEVTSIRKAPKAMLLTERLQQYEMELIKKQEYIGKTFYEDSKWLDADPIPWTRRSTKAAAGHYRGVAQTMWHNWDVEYDKDLFSLLGNINQTSDKFSEKSRGKQTLSNLVVAIGMMDIYDLTEWNSPVVDSVLVNGDNYFMECTKDISDENYELSMDDLKKDCSIFPYSFKIACTPVVEGTMFLVRIKQFNLYKALRYFFENVSRRCGIICVTKTNTKKLVAFGKLKHSEYFMLDVDSFGAPMFIEQQGLPYVMRMTSLNRLVHVLTLTLRGGDFYIFDIQISDLAPIN